eukprot:jgi/Ulvmu1/333/UM001_0337.1
MQPRKGRLAVNFGALAMEERRKLIVHISAHPAASAGLTATAQALPTRRWRILDVQNTIECRGRGNAHAWLSAAWSAVVLHSDHRKSPAARAATPSKEATSPNKPAVVWQTS